MSKRNNSGKFEGFTRQDFTFHDSAGSGKVANVFKAIVKETDFPVALKLIPKKIIEDAKIQRQTKREVQIQYRLRHPNICQLFAYFHDQNQVYLVLQYCANGTLATLIKEKHETLQNQTIAKIILQILYALAYMHQRNVMHRDLKLQNILLDANNNIKISDFGSCRHHVLQRDTFCGTMQYIAPQMLNNGKYNHSIDIYCVGVILFELFYFVSPFAGGNQDETFKNIKEGKFLFRDSVRIIPQQAKDLISLLLQKDPIKRPKAKDLFHHDFITKYSQANTTETYQQNQKNVKTQQFDLDFLPKAEQFKENHEENSFSERLYPSLQ